MEWERINPNLHRARQRRGCFATSAGCQSPTRLIDKHHSPFKVTPEIFMIENFAASLLKPNAGSTHNKYNIYFYEA